MNENENDYDEGYKQGWIDCKNEWLKLINNLPDKKISCVHEYIPHRRITEDIYTSICRLCHYKPSGD